MWLVPFTRQEVLVQVDGTAAEVVPVARVGSTSWFAEIGYKGMKQAVLDMSVVQNSTCLLGTDLMREPPFTVPVAG